MRFQRKVLVDKCDERKGLSVLRIILTHWFGFTSSLIPVEI